jgi:hypothetical protein
MTEKTKVDVELPIKCSTVKTTIKYFDVFLTTLGSVIWMILNPFVSVIAWVLIKIGTFLEEHIVQIMSTLFMGMALYLILDIPSNPTTAGILAYYALGVLAFLLGLTCSVLSSLDHYNLKLNIRCKQE